LKETKRGRIISRRIFDEDHVLILSFQNIPCLLLSHTYTRAFVSARARFSARHNRTEKSMLPLALVSNGSNNAGNSSIRRLYRATDSRQREGASLHTGWPRLTGFCVREICIAPVHARVNARFQLARARRTHVSASAHGRAFTRASEQDGGKLCMRISRGPVSPPSIHVSPVIYSLRRERGRGSPGRSGGSTPARDAVGGRIARVLVGTNPLRSELIKLIKPKLRLGFDQRE